jgi:hypothetical protein
MQLGFFYDRKRDENVQPNNTLQKRETREIIFELSPAYTKWIAKNYVNTTAK